MSQISRIGDVGIGSCPCHDGPVGYTTIFASGSANVDADGIKVTFLGTVGISSCGHSTIALSGAAFTDADGIKVHRVGDMGANCGTYIAITGSPTTDAL